MFDFPGTYSCPDVTSSVDFMASTEFLSLCSVSQWSTWFVCVRKGESLQRQ